MNLSRLAWLMQMPHTYAKCVSDQIGLIRLYLTDAISLLIISYFDTYIYYIIIKRVLTCLINILLLLQMIFIVKCHTKYLVEVLSDWLCFVIWCC